jgi:hypothetical protein
MMQRIFERTTLETQAERTTARSASSRGLDVFYGVNLLAQD